MPPFAKPTFPYDYQLPPQIAAIRAHRVTRLIPNKQPSRLLVVSWNLANFGQQQRRDKDRQIYYERLAFIYDTTKVTLLENIGHGPTKDAFTNNKGVFDFDKVVFPDLYQASERNFFAYTKYYLSDHRPVWVEFRIV